MSAPEQDAGREWCKLCAVWAVRGAVCPKAVRCSHCGAGQGQSCRRPSGHRADFLHATRYEHAEALDRAAGIVYPVRFETAAL